MSNISKFNILVALALFFHASLLSAGGALLSTPTLAGYVKVKTWKELRDANVVKQDLDYSCGAASLATVLSEFYRIKITERDILDRMEEDGTASFQDISDVAWEYGFKAKGVALNFEKLKKLKIPVIAYLKYRGDDHFSVIRGIAGDGTVWLGDPSWGNHRISKHRFLSMWETREDELFKGKILLVLPEDGADIKNINRTFFTAPVRNSLQVELLTLRTF